MYANFTDMGRAGAWKVGMNTRAASLHSDYRKDLNLLVYGRNSTAAEASDDASDDEGDTSHLPKTPCPHKQSIQTFLLACKHPMLTSVQERKLFILHVTNLHYYSFLSPKANCWQESTHPEYCCQFQ